MTKEQSENGSQDSTSEQESQWGKWLFRITLVVSAIFMWWLVIYDHGVVTHH